MEMLRDLLALSHVPRWTTHPVARPQSVAEHSYRVAVIAMHLASRCNLKVPAMYDVVWWALIHDGPEAKTGDVPSPFKVHIKKQLRDVEFQVCPWYQEAVESMALEDDSITPAIVQIADAIEAYSWLHRYGTGFKDRFDRESIEHKLTRTIWTLAEAAPIDGLKDAVRELMSEVG